MNINAISSFNQSPSFGEIRLGQGGAKRLAKTMTVNDAKSLIRGNIFNNHDILITENSTEIITPDKNIILKITKKLAGGDNFTDVEAFEHNKRFVFKIESGMTENEINRYGAQNQDISLAERIADIMKKNYDWPKFVRSGEVETADVVSPAIESAADEIEKFRNNCYSF